mmetsp:Transcript_41373/g.79115  ORF Transcript_41373/g.79115 Transcript_41373/m.79115 type:complete len:388 (-) Transcript_41373:366-1529(-)
MRDVARGRTLVQDLGDDVGLAVEVPSAIHHHAFAHEQAELAGGLLEPEREEREGDVRPVLLPGRVRAQQRLHLGILVAHVDVSRKKRARQRLRHVEEHEKLGRPHVPVGGPRQLNRRANRVNGPGVHGRYRSAVAGGLCLHNQSVGALGQQEQVRVVGACARGRRRAIQRARVGEGVGRGELEVGVVGSREASRRRRQHRDQRWRQRRRRRRGGHRLDVQDRVGSGGDPVLRDARDVDERGLRGVEMHRQTGLPAQQALLVHHDRHVLRGVSGGGCKRRHHRLPHFPRHNHPVSAHLLVKSGSHLPHGGPQTVHRGVRQRCLLENVQGVGEGRVAARARHRHLQHVRPHLVHVDVVGLLRQQAPPHCGAAGTAADGATLARIARRAV